MTYNQKIHICNK